MVTVVLILGGKIDFSAVKIKETIHWHYNINN